MQEYFHLIYRPLLVHHMTLVSFRLLRKSLGNLRETLGKWFTAPTPLAKNCPYAYVEEGHLKDKSDNRVGHLNTVLARGGGNLNNPILKSSNARSLPGGMLKFRVDRRIMEKLRKLT